MTLSSAFLILALGLTGAPASPAAEPVAAVRPAIVADSAPLIASSRSTPVADSGAAPTSQDPADAKKPPTPAHTGIRALAFGVIDDFKHLPSRPNLYIAATGTGLALAVHPLDDDVNARLRGSDNAAVPVFALGKYLGQTPVQMGAALGTYAFGRITHRSKVSHFGMDLLRAQILTGGLTAGLKYATQRERPDHSNQHSFPSGHASITFASATVIERHLGWKSSALGYAFASYVAASRLHDNRHWLSDVVAGAAVGVIGGRTVTAHGRDYWTLMPTAVPGGIAVIVTRVH